MPQNSIRTELLDLLYPPRCPICGELAPKGYDICPECTKKIPFIRTNRCKRCGKPVEEEETICPDCAEKPHVCREGLGVLVYDDVMRKVIASFKYEGRREYAKPLGRICYEEAREQLRKWKPDVLVPIPLHRKRYLKRGFNQAELIARRISELSGIPLRTSLLKRAENTAVMKTLGVKAREAELKSAFRLAGKPDGIRSVLLVDDIYTTGATCDAAAAVLYAAGVREVRFLTVCIGGGILVYY